MLALVAGQDVEQGDDGVFRIARKVARDRVISTVDPDARHGHKSRNRRFDGYKAHLSVDPDSELIDDVVVTPANTHDRRRRRRPARRPRRREDKPTVMGDSAYAGGDTRDRLGNRPASMSTPRCRRRARAGALRQGRLRHRPRGGHRRLPGRSRRDDPRRPRRAAAGPTSPALPDLPAARPVHHLVVGALGHHPPERGRAAAGQGRPGRHPNGPRATGRPTEGGTQDRSLRSPVCGAGAKPAPEATTASPPTPTPAPPPSTGPASPPSAFASTAPPGRPAPADLHPAEAHRPGRPRVTETVATRPNR